MTQQAKVVDVVTYHCFACGLRIRSKKGPCEADTRDGQWVHVGPECYKKIVAAGEAGYRPDRGGPRLFVMGQNSKNI